LGNPLSLIIVMEKPARKSKLAYLEKYKSSASGKKNKKRKRKRIAGATLTVVEEEVPWQAVAPQAKDAADIWDGEDDGA
jgi:hypothetical protein